MATPFLARVRSAFPDAFIALAGKGYVTKVLQDGPWADEIIEIPGDSKFVKLCKSVRMLRRKHFDMAVLLTNSFGSVMTMRLAGIPVVVGYARDMRSRLLSHKIEPPRENKGFKPAPMPEYYGAIADYLNCPEGDENMKLYTGLDDEDAAEEIFRQCAISPDLPVVGLNPGAAFGAAKCWPPEYFAKVGDVLARDFNMQVLVFCGPKEKPVARRIISLMDERAVALDRFDFGLDVLKALVRRLSLLVTNDSGMRHFAAAFEVPSVTMFGPTDPVWADTGYIKGRDLRVNVECGPCQKRICSREHECMKRLKPGMVIKAARELMSLYPAARLSLSG